MSYPAAPRPIRFPVHNRTWLGGNNPNLYTAAAVAAPFVPGVANNPIVLKSRQPTTVAGLNPNLFGGGAAPVGKTENTNPVRLQPRQRGHATPQTIYLPAVAVQAPFHQADYPNPVIKRRVQGFEARYNPSLLGGGAKPFKQTEWPLARGWSPRPRGVANLTWAPYPGTIDKPTSATLVSVTGIGMVMALCGVSVWTGVDDSQTPGWSEIATPSDSWSEIDTSGGGSWTPIDSCP